MVRRDVARDRHAPGLRGTDELECARGREMGEVQARPRLVAEDVPEHGEIPRHGRDLRGPRPCPQPEDRGDQALGRLRADGLLAVLRVIDHRQPLHPRI